MEGGSVGSATGLSAPNAGTVGSWPTYDLKDKKKGRKERVEATKNAAWTAGVVQGMEKAAAFIPGIYIPSNTDKMSFGRKRREYRRLRRNLKRTGRAIEREMGKVAYGRNSSVGPTTERDGPQTMSELSQETSASETTGMKDSGGHRSKRKVTRGPGNQGPRGAPEWLRGLKYLRAPGTWNGGDKSGPQETDNQFETPGAGGRP